MTDENALAFETIKPKPKPIKHRMVLSPDELMGILIDGLKSRGVDVPVDGKCTLQPPSHRGRNGSAYVFEIIETPA